MFILKISVDSSRGNEEAEKARKLEEKEKIKKEKKEAAIKQEKMRTEQKQLFDKQQKLRNEELKSKYGGTKTYGSDVNLDPGVQAQRNKNNEKADRILNEPGYAAHLAHERNNTSTFGDPSLNSWGRDRIRLGQKGNGGASSSSGGSGSERAGGDIDIKNSKGSIKHLGGDMYYAPDKNKPNDVYKVEHNPFHKLADRHEVVKKMFDGSLDESEAKKLGVTFTKADYKQEYAQHMDNKARGILSPKQREAKMESLASARERRTSLEGRINSPAAARNPVLAAKLQAKMDRVDSLIARQESTLTKSDEAIAAKDAEGGTEVETANNKDSSKPNQTERLDAISNSLNSSIASRDVSGINSAVSELSSIDSDSKSSLVNKAEAAKNQIQKDATRNIA